MNNRHQLRFTWVLLAQMTAVMLAISGFAFLESRQAMALVLRHLAEFPMASHELHANNQVFLVKILLIIALTCGMAILFGLYTSHKLAGPVLQMTRLLERVTKGDFSGRVRFRKGDHLESLAVSLNGLLATLDRQQRQLHAEIDQIEQEVDRLRIRGIWSDDDLQKLEEKVLHIAQLEQPARPVGACQG